MQFAVPQFTDVEDKIIGPLTLKQFLVLVAAGGLMLLFWSILPKPLAVLLDIPIGLGGIGLALANYNGRPALSYIFPFVSYLLSPKLMVFKRERNAAAPVITSKTEPRPEPAKFTAQEEPDSRLRKLAYLLDQKTQQEKELIDRRISQAAESAALAAAQPAITQRMQQEGKEILSKLIEPKVARPVIENTDRIVEMKRVMQQQQQKSAVAASTKTKTKPRPMGVNLNQRSILDS